MCWPVRLVPFRVGHEFLNSSGGTSDDLPEKSQKYTNELLWDGQAQVKAPSELEKSGGVSIGQRSSPL